MNKKLISYKLLITLLILFFNLQSSTKADNINDFDIDGISIGESFLKYVSKNLIEHKYKSFYPKSKEYFLVEFDQNDLNFLKNYTHIGIHFKENDNKYKVYSIKGMMDYDNDLNGCLNQKKIIVKSINETLENSEEEKYENNFDNLYGKSKAYISDFKVDNGYIRVWCTDWDKSADNAQNWVDTINVDLSNQTFLDWLNTKAYD